MIPHKFDLQNKSHFCYRFYIYLVERFSLLTALPALILHYFFIARYTTHSFLSPNINYWVVTLTFISFFIWLRVIDEFKDKTHDDIYYPERPVQRGLINLNELRIFLLISIPLVVILNIIFNNIFGLTALAASLIFLFIMRYEFFASSFLKDKLILYALLHEILIPFLVSFVILSLGGSIYNFQTLLFIALNFIIIFSVEVSRKIRSPQEENASLDTYSAYLGPSFSIILWWTMILFEYILFLELKLGSPWIGLLLLLNLVSGLIYLKNKTNLNSKFILITNLVFNLFLMLASFI